MSCPEQCVLVRFECYLLARDVLSLACDLTRPAVLNGNHVFELHVCLCFCVEAVLQELHAVMDNSLIGYLGG